MESLHIQPSGSIFHALAEEWRGLGSEDLEEHAAWGRGLSPWMIVWIRAPPPLNSPPPSVCQLALSGREQEIHLYCGHHTIRVVRLHWLTLRMSKVFIKCPTQWKCRFKIQEGKRHDFPFHAKPIFLHLLGSLPKAFFLSHYTGKWTFPSFLHKSGLSFQLPISTVLPEGDMVSIGIQVQPPNCTRLWGSLGWAERGHPTPGSHPSLIESVSCLGFCVSQPWVHCVAFSNSQVIIFFSFNFSPALSSLGLIECIFPFPSVICLNLFYLNFISYNPSSASRPFWILNVLSLPRQQGIHCRVQIQYIPPLIFASPLFEKLDL